MKRKTSLCAELSWTEFAEAMKKDDVVVIPAGILEQHGLHNPLGTDTFIAEHCAREIAERSGCLAAPVFPYGYGPEGRNFPGQVSLSPGLLRNIWYAYAASYARHGARRFLFVNGHGGNGMILRTLAGDLWRDCGAVCAVTEWWVTVPCIKPELACNDHGGLYETSCALSLRPELVDMGRAADSVPDAFLSEHIRAGYETTFKGQPFFAAVDDYALGRAGNLGASPAGASAELGRDVLEAYIDYNAGLIEELRKIHLKKRIKNDEN
jgi:creatinine amidohydrolase